MSAGMRNLVLLITLLCAWATTSHAQTKVEIFYETLSDVGRKFFVEQYKVVTDNLLDSIDLHLYPYGKTIQDGTTYTCPYGDTQCEANRIHACLISAENTPSTGSTTPEPTTTTEPTTTLASVKSDSFSNRKNLVESWAKSSKSRAITDPINAQYVTTFVNCFFKNRFAKDNVEDLGSGCLPNDVGADWGEIRECVFDPAVNGPLLEQLAAVTGTVNTDIQTDGLVIRIGNTVNNAAKSNFLGEICKALPKDDGICNGTATAPTKVKLGVYYEAFHSDASNYITKQLYTYYHVLEDFVDIDLIPYGNAQFDSASGTYNCTNDPQCISNKFQALVVDTYIGKPKNGDPISGENRAINFISCVFSSSLSNVYQSLEACSNQKLEPDDYRYFIDLIRFNDPTVTTIWESMKTKTEAVETNGALTRLPLVTVNGQVDYNAFDDLVQEACAQYKGPIKAGICTKVTVTVLYEALNHKSRTLFLEQLNPVFNNLYNLINLQLIPAGRAVNVPGFGFVCPGGAEQCQAMMLQACALDNFWNDGNNYTDPIRQEVFEFLVCTFKNKRLLNVMDSHAVCSEQYLEVDTWVDLRNCLFDGSANAIFYEYIQETQSLIVNVVNHSIPIVLINGAEVTDLTTIKAQICGLYDEYHAPDYCTSEAAPKVKIQVYYEAMNELSKYFFTSQFEPWYMYVEEMANIELLPAGNVIEVNNTDGTCDSYEANSVCMANKMQAFVIDKYSKHDDDGDFIDGTLRTAEFLGCYFNHPNFKDNIYAAAEYCVEEKLGNDEWFDLLVTSKAPEGNAIYKGVLDATAAFKAQIGVSAFDQEPWVTLDGNTHSKRAADDLLQTVCSQYAGTDKPLECTPVQVQVYYSGINPQSRRFFLDQLIPTFRNLRERVHLELIPYGVVDPTQTIEEECATKDLICLANKVQACAIVKYFNDEVIDNSVQWDGKNQTLSFIQCMFKNIGNKDIMTLAEDCLNQNVILGDEVTACAHQGEGLTLLDEMRNKTMGQYETMEHAPWIVINGHRSALAQSDLKQAICDNMVGDKPLYCENPTPAKVKVEFHYSSVSSDVQSYVINELYPHYRLLEEIIDLDVVPYGLTEIISQGEGSNNYTLICPNGVQECSANQIHACIYKQYYHADDDPIGDIQDQREYDHKLMVIEYINCYFTRAEYPSKPVDAAMECVEMIFNDDFSTVHECVTRGLGIQWLLEFQQQKVNTLLPHLTYTPWITLNGKHSYSVEHHIQRAVCDAYTGTEKPLDCYQIYDQDPKPYVTIHYEIGDNSSKNFFTSALDPTISSGVADIHLVPFGRSTYTDATNKNCVNNADCSQYLEHACLIKLFYQEHAAKVLEVVACTFGDLMNDPNVVNECVDLHLDVTDAWPDIHSCMATDGDALMKEYAAVTAGLHPKISHVPWILVNDEHNLEAEANFINEICYVYYPADKPTLCLPTLQPVAVYYETANNDVGDFFLNQLSQYTEYLGEIADFSFIPYGTTQNANGQFTCTNTDQCTANIAHACILNRFYNRSSVNPDSEYEKNRIRFAEFLECTALQQSLHPTESPVNVANDCLDINFGGDLWRDIHFCAAGPEGQELYTEMARQTAALNPSLTSAPYVTINGQNNLNARTNLFQVLCNSYGNVRPPLCSTLPSFAVKVGVYFSSNAAGQKFFHEQLLPFYSEIVPALRDGADEAALHAVIAPDLVAWGETTYDSTNAQKPFTCPSDNECFTNRLFACIEHYHGAEKKYNLHKMEFALCFFEQTNALTSPEEAANICANRVWIPDPYIQLEMCAKTNDADSIAIFLKAKEKTENNYPHITTFPSVTINNELDSDGVQNLLKLVCQSYKGYDTPADCAPFVNGTTSTTTASPGTGTDSGTPVPTTTPKPGGSGAFTPTASIFVLLVSLFICRFF